MENKMKRFLSLLLAMVMVIGMLPTNIAFAAEDDVANSGGIVYGIIDGTHNVRVTDGKSASGDIVIPEKVTIDGTEYTVTAIAGDAFNDANEVTSIVVPNTVTQMGGAAFANMDKLKSLTIGNGVTNWGSKLAVNNSELETVVIAEGATLIGDLAFRSCPKLANVTLPSTLKTIGATAFAYAAITELNIPASVENIGADAFKDIDTLKKVTFNSAPKNLSTTVFQQCDGLEEVVLPEGLSAIPQGTFRYCTSLKTINFPESLTEIGNYSFQGCTSLESVTISKDITNLVTNAFNGCTSLKNLTIEEGFAGTIGGYAFQGCTALESVVIPSSMETVGESMFNGCTSLKNITLSEGVKTLNISAFNGCTSLKSLTLPDSLERMRHGSIANCTALEELIILGDNLPVIEHSNALEGLTEELVVVYAGDDEFTGNWAAIAGNVVEKMPEKITGTITEDKVWNDGDIVEGVTISGNVTITVNGKVTVKGQIAMDTAAANNVTFKAGTEGGTLVRGSGYTGTVIQAVGTSEITQNVTIDGITMDGGAVWAGENYKTLERGTTNTGVVAANYMINAQYAVINIKNATVQNHAGGTAVIHAYAATLNISDSTVRNNYSNNGYHYGGFATMRVGATFIAEDSQFYGNHGDVGSIAGVSSSGSYNATMKFTDCKFYNNYAPTGGLFRLQDSSYKNNIGELTLIGCEISENSSEKGLIYSHVYGTPIYIVDTKIHDNQSSLYDYSSRNPNLFISGNTQIKDNASYSGFELRHPVIISGKLGDDAVIEMSAETVAKLMTDFGYIASDYTHLIRIDASNRWTYENLENSYQFADSDWQKFSVEGYTKYFRYDVDQNGINDIVPLTETQNPDEITITLKDSKDENASKTLKAYTCVAVKPANPFVHDGYTFSHWITEADLDNKKPTKITSFKVYETDTTLYAQYSLSNPTVTLSKNGATLTANVTNAADGLTYTYQWQKNSVAISGATSATYTITDAADAEYKCTVTVTDGTSKKSATAKGTFSAAVAKIGTQGYATLAEALAAANVTENGATVTVLTDIALDSPFVITGTVVLDLAGYTLSYDSTTQGEAMITNKGTLTINDSSSEKTGVINYNYTGAADSTYVKGNYTIDNAGTLTVNGGKITIADLRAHAKYPVNNNSTSGNAVLVINGGHLYNYNTAAIRQYCNSTTNQNSVTITGGLIEGYSAIWMQNPGKNTVNGSLSITGGEIRTTAAAYVNGTSALKDVSSKLYCTIDGEGGAWDEMSAVSITGGTINENVYLAANAPAAITIVEGATFNGYVKLPAVPVAQIGETKYKTLQDAIDNATEGDIIKLIANITLGENLIIEKNITLVGEHTITRADDYTGTLFTVNAGATLTLDGGLTVDGNNNWSIDANNVVTPEAGKPVATGFMIDNGGMLNVFNATLQNQYSEGTGGSTEGAIIARSNSVTNLVGATIRHFYTQDAGSAVRLGHGSTTCNNATLNIGEGTNITGNIGDWNGALIIVYGSNTINMTGGNINNNIANRNGTLIMLYGAGSSMTMSGGVITENKGPVPAIYMHSSSSFEMTGGEISKNTGGAALYVRSNAGSASISGGKIVNNEADIWVSSSKTDDVNISGGTFTQDVNLWCADGFKAEENADGTYVVKEDPTYGKVAMIGETGYETLQAAIDNATEGNIIKLIADIDLADTYVVISAKKITLDLNGKTISGTGSAVIQLAGTMTLVDTSDAKSGKIAHTGPNDSSSAVSISNGNLIVKSGSIISNQKAVQAGGSGKTNTITINGGMIQGDDVALNINKGSNTVSITGGKLISDNYAIHVADGNGQVLAGLTISGAEVTGKLPEVTDVTEGKLSITGGSFSVDPSVYVAEGYIAEAENGIYVVYKDVYVAEVNGVKYESLADAVTAVPNNGTATIVILKDYTETKCRTTGDYAFPVWFGNGKNITLDFDGHTVTFDTSAYADHKIQSVFYVSSNNTNASLTLTGNGTVKYQGPVGNGTTNMPFMYMAWAQNCDIIVKNGTYIMGADSDTTYANMFYITLDGNIYIEDGTFIKDATGDETSFINVSDASDGVVTATGGTFYENILAETQEGELVIPDSYSLVDNGDGTWTVINEYVKMTAATLLYEDMIRIRYKFAVAEEDVVKSGLLIFASEEDAKNLQNILQDTALVENTNGSYYGYTAGIAAKNMGESQFAVGYAKLSDGRTVYTGIKEYSPRIYARNMVNKDTTTAETKVLCNALMNYGAAAQVYKNYKTDALMNEGFAAIEYDASVLGDDIFRVDITETNGFTTKSANLLFDGELTYRVKYAASEEITGNTLYAEYTVKGETKSVELKLINGAYYAYICGIAAKDMDEKIVVKPYYTDDSGNKVYGAELVYSGYEYVRRTVNNSKDANSVALAKAFAMYIDAADKAIAAK